jgi:hypothetical protein
MGPCIYCGAPWPYPEPIEHATNCPSITGLFPVLDSDLGHKVECECGRVNRWPGGFGCVACGHQFAIGEFYVHRSISDNLSAIVCLSCEATGRPLNMDRGSV